MLCILYHVLLRRLMVLVYVSVCDIVCRLVLLQACFDCKPRIISKRRLDHPSLCANTQTQHQFDKTKYVRKQT